MVVVTLLFPAVFNVADQQFLSQQALGLCRSYSVLKYLHGICVGHAAPFLSYINGDDILPSKGSQQGTVYGI